LHLQRVRGSNAIALAKRSKRLRRPEVHARHLLLEFVDVDYVSWLDDHRLGGGYKPFSTVWLSLDPDWQSSQGHNPHFHHNFGSPL